VIWSYSRLSELPQHLQMPPSLVKTIFFVVAEMYRLWEKQAALKNKIANNKNNFLMLLLGFQVALIDDHTRIYTFSVNG